MKRLLALVATLLSGPAAAQTTLPDLLTALDQQLAIKRPDYAALLRPPLTAARIAALEQQHGLTLPAEVKALYLWHDGQDPQSFDALANNMMFLPLDEALRTKAKLDSMIGHDFTLENWWHPGWLPLFHNGGGDHLVVDMAGIHTGNAGQMLTAYHDWEYRPIEADSLTAFAQALLAYLETTAAEDMDEFHDLKDHLPETGQSFTASGAATPLD